MAANLSPPFTITPIVGAGNLVTANTNRDGSGTVVTLFTAGANGSTVENVHVKYRVTSTVGMIRLFLYDGTNYRFWHEIPVTAITASSTVATFEADWQPPGVFVLPTGWTIVGATAIGESSDVTINGGSF